ncbi:MAG TPA: aminopeptidase P family protein [Firmicutes bacterium]|nr:aminopeptidase P family protein [Candidatus Fermentithermobacillaceae bacterium]
MNQRIQKLQGLLQHDGVDGVLYATSANMQYLFGDISFRWQRTPETGGLPFSASHESGHFLNRPDCVLYVPADGEPVLVATYERAEELERGSITPSIKIERCYYVMIPEALSGYVRGKRIAHGESCGGYLRRTISRIVPGAEVVEGEKYGEELRKIKDESELEKLRKAAEFTDQAMAEIVPSIRPGVRPKEIEGLLIDIARRHGLDLSFPPACICVTAGAPGSETLFGPPEEFIKAGSAVTFDFGYVVDGYCSDFGRAFYCGRAEKLLVDAYKALQEAQCYLLEILRPGMRMDMTYRVLYDFLEKRGLGRYLRDYDGTGIMGHQIGIDLHERPWLHDKAEEVFEAGMVMCIEPKLWFPGKAYMRVEDMVLLTDNGCESLTKFDRELFELEG